MEAKTRKFYFGEAILILTGITFIVSTIVLFTNGSMGFWFSTKILYALGILFIIFDR